MQHPRQGASQGPQTLYTPLSAVVRRAPVTCPPQSTIRSVLETMHRLRIGSMIVAAPDSVPVGIFTLHDLLRRVALPSLDMAQPISTVMSTELVSLPPHALAFQAALAMVRHGIRHVLVTEEGGRLAGVVSENDLFSLQRIGFREIGANIQSATDIPTLAQVASDIRQLAHNMLGQGVGAEQLTQFISVLNDRLTERVIELEFAGADLGGVRFCWIALGSEGRLEQTFESDQDNAIVFSCASQAQTEAARQRLLAAATRVNKSLGDCGFALCKGNIMAGNPQWCLSFEEWKKKFAAWIDHGDPDSLLNASIFFDFREIYGDAEPVRELRDWLTGKAKANPRFLHQMAANALRNRPPLGFLRDFDVEARGEHANSMDLKLRGTHLFVDAARIFSLATGVPHTNTHQRLRAAAGPLKVPAAEAEAWSEAFGFLLLLRLRNQLLVSETGAALGNYLDPRRLNELERHFLKQSLRQAQKIQARLALDYQL
jgi:CBS domain-containing protein